MYNGLDQEPIWCKAVEANNYLREHYEGVHWQTEEEVHEEMAQYTDIGVICAIRSATFIKDSYGYRIIFSDTINTAAEMAKFILLGKTPGRKIHALDMTGTIKLNLKYTF